MAVFAEEPPIVKGDSSVLLAIDEMAYGLPGAGGFDDTIVRVAMRTVSLFGNRQMKGNQVIIQQVLDEFDSCLLWESCNVVTGFHSCFTSYAMVGIFLVNGCNEILTEIE